MNQLFNSEIWKQDYSINFLTSCLFIRVNTGPIEEWPRGWCEVAFIRSILVFTSIARLQSFHKRKAENTSATIDIN